MSLNHRGEAKIGCVLSILLIIAVAYCGYKTVPAYYYSVQFLDEVDALVRRAAVYNWTERKILDSLLKLAMDWEQPVAKENIKIQHTRYNLIVDIEYKLPMDLGFYKFDLERKQKYAGLAAAF